MAVGLATLLLSTGPLFDASLLDFLSPVEIMLGWLEHLLELAVIALLLLVTYTVLDEAMPPAMPLRLGSICAVLLCVSCASTVLLYAYYAHSFVHLPPTLRLAADSMRWGLPAAFLALIADMHQRALKADTAATALELIRAQVRQGDNEQRLSLLQAQIEPHFLFNVLGNVRRLYRTQPEGGAEAIASLKLCLASALPLWRSQSNTLGDELKLVRAYLHLFQVRMGTRLSVEVQADEALHGAELPPMLLLTLVENAIKHGVEPAGGGEVRVEARRRASWLEITVMDDGMGFGGAASSGTGVGLVNIRRQLAARYAGGGSLTLASREPRGAVATLTLPLRGASPG